MEPTQQTPLAIWNTARDVWETPGTEGFFCEHLDVFSETWPTSGSMRSGAVYALPTWGPHTAASASSCLLPTPDAYAGSRGGSQNPEKRRAGGHSVSFSDVVEHKLLPSPRASEGEKGGPNMRGSKGDLMLSSAVTLLPTPAASIANDGEGTETWLARRERVKLTAANGNGMGMPLTIAALLIQESIGANTNQSSEPLFQDVPLPFPEED